jgi:hypothetical protein
MLGTLLTVAKHAPNFGTVDDASLAGKVAFDVHTHAEDYGAREETPA